MQKVETVTHFLLWYTIFNIILVSVEKKDYKKLVMVVSVLVPLFGQSFKECLFNC